MTNDIPTNTFSPHAWGWTDVIALATGQAIVFPTRVGVDLLAAERSRDFLRFPHTRGGGPHQINAHYLRIKFSPHAWGWT